MAGIIAKKADMTRLVQGGEFVPVTLLVVPELTVAEQRMDDKHGYRSVVLKATDGKQSIIREVPATGALADLAVGSVVSLDILDGVQTVEMHGVSKGKGFAGAVKRYHFKGGPGRVSSKFHRALGSIGCRKPRRVKPGKKMHGHMGSDRITVKDIPVVVVDKERRVVAVKGPVPGGRNSYITLDF